MPSSKKISSVSASFLDSNAWVALTFQGHSFHHSAKSLLREASPQQPVCICRAVEQSWLRLISTPAIQKSSDSPLIDNKGAIATVEWWLSNPCIKTIDEPSGTRALWLQLACRSTASPKLWMDAYLAAFAISANLRFVTSDRGFRQFESAGLDLYLLTA